MTKEQFCKELKGLKWAMYEAEEAYEDALYERYESEYSALCARYEATFGEPFHCGF